MKLEKLAIKEFPMPVEAIASGKGIVFASNKYRAIEKYVEIRLKI